MIFPVLKGLLRRVLWKKHPMMTDFESSYKVLLFEKTLLCGNLWQHEGGPLNIFGILQGRLFSLLVITTAAFNGGKDIKMSNSIFHAIL